MKSFYVPAAILAAILCISLAVGSYSRQQSDRWGQQLTEAHRYAREESWPEAAAAVEAVYDEWKHRQLLFYSVMEHDDLDEARTLFVGCLAAAQEQDSSDFHVQLSQLVLQLQLLAETQAVSIQNIL